MKRHDDDDKLVVDSLLSKVCRNFLNKKIKIILNKFYLFEDLMKIFFSKKNIILLLSKIHMSLTEKYVIRVSVLSIESTYLQSN